ncbi:unnamed protein product [Clavelina lepadiformis]|uniref:cellulase n=1 Tax=Clavelina lepadiformis TaxID=159417 RepID=A0ABP0GCZ4_CLALP
MHFLAVDFVSSCVTPERDATFGDFATRSDVVLQAKVVNVGARISSKGMYAARFQVTGLFLTKRGDYAVGDFLNLWPFGNNPNCVAVKINSQHILFLKEVEGKIKNKPLYKLRYNPVPLIKRNLVFFSRFLEGRREALLDEEKLISHNELINGSENFSLKQEKDIPTPHAFISSTVGQQVTTTQAAQQQQDISEEKKLPLSSDLLLGCPIYNGTVYINSIWRGGFGGYVYFPSSSQTIKNGWLVKIDFNIPVTDLKTYTVHVREADEKFFEFCLTPKYYSRNIYKHQTTTISFVGKYKYTDSLPQISGQSKLFGVCDSAKTYEVYKAMGHNQADVIDNVMKSCLGARMTSTQVQEETKTTTSYLNNSDITTEILTTAFVPTPSENDFDYNEVLHKSILFYEAQRSGRLPEDNRIPWRGDSDLKDGCLTNDNLSGGWYTAGGNVKTTFLIAFSTTMLSWGALDYSAAYQAAGEMENVLAQIRWATDYLMKCHLMKNTLVVQVGRYIPNSLSWQPPELSDPEMRTVIKSTPETPDCKTTAEVAAAFAAASLVFKTHDLSYSRECLNRARELFNFSEKYKEIKETHNINTFYRKKENGTLKVIAWAATWLHKATGDQKYLVRVEDLYRTFRKQSNIFSWDDKSRGLAVLLGKLSNKPQKYKRIISRYIKWVQDTARKTPSGLLWIIRRTPTMHAANAAFLTLQAIELSENQTIKRQYHSFAEKQTNLLLGLNQTGYVVGIGSNAPKRPHHRASTCPLPPANCSRSVLDQEQPNAHILHGALVNGPDRNGRFPDKAYDIAHSRVGIDFNAGFQSLAAGLKYYQMSLL